MHLCVSTLSKLSTLLRVVWHIREHSVTHVPLETNFFICTVETLRRLEISICSRKKEPKLILLFWPRDSAKRSRSYKWQLLLCCCVVRTFVLIELYDAILLWICKSDSKSKYWAYWVNRSTLTQFCSESDFI